MPTSVTGRKADCSSPLRAVAGSRGFTIIEILVVIVVIGVLVSIFTLSFGNFAEDQGAEDMRRLEALLNLASEEAAMQGREIGLTFYQHGYEFAVLENYIDEDNLPYQQWDVLEEDRVLRPRNLGEELEVDLELDDEEVVLLYERDSEVDYEPQVFVLSSGEIEPPFRARIRPAFENQGYLLQADADGTLTVSDEAFEAR